MRAGGLADGRTDRLTDVTKLIVAFRSFANARKTEIRVVTYLVVSGLEIRYKQFRCLNVWT
jgi:hypothetical protein